MPILGSFAGGSGKGFGLTMAGKKIEGISFLVLAGGGGGGSHQGGGGGAGGYRLADSSNPSDKSGGPDNAPGLQEDAIDLFLNKPYSVIVGAGGAAAPNTDYPYSYPGSPSVFATITSIGGGGGAGHPGPNPGTNPANDFYYTNPYFPYLGITPSAPGATLPANAPSVVVPPSIPVAPFATTPFGGLEARGLPGGSGGGNTVGSGANKLSSAGDSGNPAYRGPGTPNQGYPGGLGGTQDANPFPGGGGGGIGSAGTNATPGPPPGASPQPGNGGPGGSGLSSSITGTPVTRGGGGGGGSREDQGPGGSGGPGGGGSWRDQNPGTAGGTNQGAGGGPSNGSNQGQFPGGNGGSGVVVIKIPTTYTATFSPGVTQTPSTTPTHRIYNVTATSDSSQTVTFTEA